MSLSEIPVPRAANPVETVEHLAAAHGWSFARASEDELTLVISGLWADYQASFTWMGDIEVLHLACAIDLKFPERRRADMTELVSMINEELWVGHFDVWANDGLVMFRHALVLTGGAAPSGPQCEFLLATAVDACERYYQAFQYLLWAGKSPREAIKTALFETRGEA
jgi:hypothetical protein